MPFPEVRYCLIAEEVRQEPRGKLTVLGLFGVAPHVRILVKDFADARLRLSFAFFGGSGSGSAELDLQIAEQSGGVVTKLPRLKTDIPSGDYSSSLIFNLSGVKIPRPGVYEVRLSADGQIVFTTSFRVEQGEAQ
jgi:hypothetical protein